MGDDSKMLNFFMNAPAAIAITHGPQHVFTFANPLYEKIFGRDLSQLLNRSIREVWPEIGNQGIYEIFDEVFNTGVPYTTWDFPATFLDHGVETKGYFDYTVHPIKDAAGRVTDIMVHAVDVTDRTLADLKVKRNEHRLQLLTSLTQSISDAVIATDHEFNIISWNEGAEKMYGWTSAEVIGKNAATLLPTTFKDEDQAWRTHSCVCLNIQYQKQGRSPGGHHRC
jgi:PAS domain S-box-containing protein